METSVKDNDLKNIAGLLRQQNAETSNIKSLLQKIAGVTEKGNKEEANRARRAAQQKIAADGKGSGIMKGIKGVGGDIAGTVGEGAKGFFDKLKKLLGFVAGLGAMAILSDPAKLEAMKEGLITAWNVVKSVFNAGKWVVKKIMAFAKWVWNKEDGTIMGIDWPKLIADGKAFFVDTYESIKTKISDFAKWVYSEGVVMGLDVPKLITDVKKFFVDTYKTIKTKIGDFASWVYSDGVVMGLDVPKLIEDVKKFFVDTYETIKTKISDFAKWVYSDGVVMGLDVPKLITDVKKFFVDTYETIKEKLGSFATFVYDSKTGEIFGINFKTLISDITTKVIDTVKGIPAKISGFFTDMWDKITTMFDNFVKDMIASALAVIGIETKKTSALTVAEPGLSEADAKARADEAALMGQGVVGLGSLAGMSPQEQYEENFKAQQRQKYLDSLGKTTIVATKPEQPEIKDAGVLKNMLSAEERYKLLSKELGEKDDELKELMKEYLETLAANGQGGGVVIQQNSSTQNFTSGNPLSVETADLGPR